MNIYLDADMEKLAEGLATGVHCNQVDKIGDPYILHVRRVAESFPVHAPVLRTIGWLHDVVEDTSFTLQLLADLGFSPRVVEAVEALTHPKGETNIDYWRRVKANPDALEVKLADNYDNSDPDRLALIEPADTRHRLGRKYTMARTFLMAEEL